MAGPCNWNIDPDDVCDDWSGYSPTVQENALSLATLWLWGATGRRYGPCPVTVRPARTRTGAEILYQAFPVRPGADGLIGQLGAGPFLFGGRWFNAGCVSACCGATLCAIELRGPIASVDEVLVDGDVVPPSAYRVDLVPGAWLLVRIDGECWPVCQNFRLDTDQPDTFEVTYSAGLVVPAALATAAALLACEYGKQLTGGKCSLPAKMTRLSRQGVEIEVAPPEPAEGLTGIKLVDDVITALNPGRLKSPPRVMSPELDSCDRYTVIPAGS